LFLAGGHASEAVSPKQRFQYRAQAADAGAVGPKRSQLDRENRPAWTVRCLV